MPMTYQQKIEDRLRWKFLTEYHENKEENQRVFLELAKNDALFWINNVSYTYDPRGDKEIDRHLPFILYEYEEEAVKTLVKHIEEGRDLLFEKSRDMGASWTIIAVLHWGWKFKGWDILLGSRKADLVDKRGDINSLMEKVRYIESRLPDFVKTKLVEGDTDKSFLIKHPHNGNVLAGESNNPHFGTGGRYKAVVYDEFSKWDQTDEIAWRSAGDSTPCRIANSTPSDRGTKCHFYKLIEQGIDKYTFHWLLHPKKRIGMYYLQDSQKIYLKETEVDKALILFNKGIRVGSEWYDKECERRSQIEIAQELDISYDASLSGRIFDKFDPKFQVGDYEYNENLPLYVAWDYGMDTTSMVFIQYDGKHHYIIDEYENKGEDILHYLEVLLSKPYKAAIHCGDPYSGGVRQMQDKRTVAQILMSHGIRITLTKRVSINDRINASRMILQDLRVDNRCVLFQEMMDKWRFKKQLRDNDKPLPEHSVHSHIGEAFGYYAVSFREKQIKRQTVNKIYKPSLSGVTL